MSRNRTLLAPLLALLIVAWAFVVYVVTLAPTVTLVDSGELISAACLLDIAHPPGTPLYVLIGHLFSKLPIGTPAFRLNMMSAVFGAIATAAVFLLTLATLRLPLGVPEKKRGKPARNAPESQLPARQLAASLIVGLTFATSATLWSYSTVAEVYTLNTCLLALALLFFARAASPETGGSLSAGFLFFGLALAVHHVSALFFVPAGIYLLWRARPEATAPEKHTIPVTGTPDLPVSSPARRQSPGFELGTPSTAERFLWHVTGKQYRSNLTADWSTLFSRLWFFLKLWGSELTLLGFLLVLLGFWVLYKRQKWLCLAGLMTVAVNLAYALAYDISEDNEAYALPTFIIFGVALGWGILHVLQFAYSRRKLLFPGLLAIALLPVLSLVLHYGENNHRRYTIGEDYGRDALENSAPGGVVLTMDWQLYSPLLYLQNVERRRPDVVAIDLNLLRRSWYLDYLGRRYPDLMRKVQDEAEIFRGQLQLFEHEAPYDPAIIQQAFLNVINAIIDTSFQSTAVYMTVDVSEQPGIAQSYVRVPKGPIFRLFSEKPSQVSDAGTWHTAAFTQPSLKLDQVMLRVRKNYALMEINRGIYLTLYNRHSEAVDWYRKGLALDPDTPAGHLMLARSYTALSRPEDARRSYRRVLELEPNSGEARAELEKLQ